MMKKNKKMLLLFLLGIPLFTTQIAAGTEPLKEWTVLIYMAADNDLLPFADRNLEQMKQIGTNNNINILVHLNTHRPREKKITKKLIVYKDRFMQVGADESRDSGDENTLIDACRWAYKDFPSNHVILVFWNHGSGDLNPLRGRSLNPSVLFTYNRDTHLLELDRSISFLDFIENSYEGSNSASHRGVCFDETTGNYLNDQKLKRAFSTICSECLGGKKIDYILWDTCLMGGIGTVFNCSSYAKRIVVSEEVVLGTGYNYAKVFAPLAQGTLSWDQFASHVVRTYEETYSKITNDYTQSALELSEFAPLHQNIDLIAQLFNRGIEQQRDKSVTFMLKRSRDKYACTHFNEPSYIDLSDFYKNVLKNIGMIQLKNSQETEGYKNQIINAINHGLELLKKVVIINSVGKNLKNAGGISVYFPENIMHPSFPATEFAQNNNWLTFIKNYLRTRDTEIE